MYVTVQKWGNSLALRIPHVVAKQVNVHQGSRVDMSLVANKIILTAREKDVYPLAGLLKKITKSNLHEEALVREAARQGDLVRMSSFVPERGDLIWLNFDPQAGHERSGFRPAFVVSPKEYNRKVGLAICCPVTNQIKGYPFEVLLPEILKTKGVVLADQVKNLDWRIRKAKFIEHAPPSVTKETLAKIKAIVG